MQDYLFKTEPFDHQLTRFYSHREKEFHGHLWEQGTGKSKISIDTAAYLYAHGEINCVVVVAPNGVHRNWIINEFPSHCPEYIDYNLAFYASSLLKLEKEALIKCVNHKGLKVIGINVEAMATKRGVEFLKELLFSNACMLILDESTVIKNPKAIRTKALLKLSKHARYKRILTGTPITQSPLDAFTQFTFLDENILRTSSYYAFRNRYCIMKEIRTNGRSLQIPDKYVNLDELQELISPYSDRVLKEDCLDLPDKLYQKRYVELSPAQASLYKELKKELLVEFEGKSMSAPLALTKLLRLQQIVGGFFQPDVEIEFDDNMEPIIKDKTPPKPIDKTNKRVAAVVEILEETTGKAIIWARFRAEIASLVQAIKEKFGKDSFVEYHGGVSNSERSDNIDMFQNHPKVRFFIGHVQAGGKGLTLHAASTVIYYSNNFSLEDRLQSEDRAHRIGQTKNVTYIDIIAPNTLDEQVVKVLRSKKNIADLITGDVPLENWV